MASGAQVEGFTLTRRRDWSRGWVKKIQANGLDFLHKVRDEVIYQEGEIGEGELRDEKV